MTEKIISEINLDLVFKCNEFSQFSNKLNDSKNKLIFEKKSFSLGLQIISNQEIAFLNQKWMQKNGPTDVLSFPIISDETLENLDHIELGDIFISLEIALAVSYTHLTLPTICSV